MPDQLEKPAETSLSPDQELDSEGETIPDLSPIEIHEFEGWDEISKIDLNRI